MILSVKSSLILGENKAGFRRESHILLKICYGGVILLAIPHYILFAYSP